ncbi:MAG: hypothetical protein ACI8QC_003972 [Planctomycetota bacterium]
MIQIPTLALLALACMPPQVHSEAETYKLQLPPGPAARAWAGVGPSTPAAPLSAELLALLEPGVPLWEQAETWQLWAERLSGLGDRLAQDQQPGMGRDQSSASARAELCLLAAAQGRGADAWAHFARLTDDPGLAARVAPLLIPGVPLETKIGPGGVPQGLPDGASLYPILPEYPADSPAADLTWRKAEVLGLRIGEAQVRLSLAVESSGVELELEHQSGPTIELAARLPAPAEFAIRYEYVDWERVPNPREAHGVRLIPGEEEPHTVYGRVAAAPTAWPTPRPGALSARLLQDGLWLVIASDDPEHGLWQATAVAIGKLLGVPAGTREPVSPGTSRTGVELPVPPEPFDLKEADQRAAFGRYLASALEAHVLHRPVR